MESPTCLEILNGGKENVFQTFEKKNNQKLKTLKANCDVLKKAYDTLSETCKMAVDTNVNCNSTVEENFNKEPWEKFHDKCEQKLDEDFTKYKEKNCKENLNCIIKEKYKEMYWKEASGKDRLEIKSTDHVLGNTTKQFPTFLRGKCKPGSDDGVFCSEWEEDESVDQKAIDTIKGGLQTNSALFGSQTL